MTPTEYRITTELDLLRRRWASEPENRQIIELQAKVLKLSLDVATEQIKTAAGPPPDPLLRGT